MKCAAWRIRSGSKRVDEVAAVHINNTVEPQRQAAAAKTRVALPGPDRCAAIGIHGFDATGDGCVQRAIPTDDGRSVSGRGPNPAAVGWRERENRPVAAAVDRAVEAD